MIHKITFIVTILFVISMTTVSAQCISGDCENGEGVYMYLDSTVYTGKFKNSKANGYGVCHYSNNDKYVGEWKDHDFHGKGTFYSKSGRTYVGRWEKGKIVEKYLPATKGATTNSKDAPKVWAVVVGVAKYDYLRSLHFTDDDAYRMYAFLKSPEGGALPDNNITLLIDERATKENILAAVEATFGKAGKDDMVLFYYSGHGLKDSFLPIDYDGLKNKLYHSEFLTSLDKSKAKHKICLIDACYSGGLLAYKGDVKDKVENSLNSYYSAVKSSSGGSVLITSSKEAEASIEDRGLRQGVFSHFLIKALRGEADADKNNIVTVKEAFKYIERNVTNYTNDYQTPMILGDFDDKMPISVVRH